MREIHIPSSEELEKEKQQIRDEYHESRKNVSRYALGFTVYMLAAGATAVGSLLMLHSFGLLGSITEGEDPLKTELETFKLGLKTEAKRAKTTFEIYRNMQR